ncbi:GNAT family N-acetyltransferase [Algoriphagus sediminis]|uniref:GNAT family N-acetyltransferase n=1 Tax=Algoriphagus sediminis TaxID=3057113 RepID=A0ABT7Y8B9_9BACT|nr:GNAT family N-acetyltransferase [Algoriphagus sediminis]MDN3202758.1 GNAT family N-acetyltransferase [Algoriphagus sediminis]
MQQTFEILPYSRELQKHFEEINLPWVEGFFSVEPVDQAQFDDPENVIIKKGGSIIFAKHNEKIVGTVALSKVDHETFEMIKMGVRPEAQGLGIGRALGEAIIQKAKEMGGKKLILYSNSKLGTALRLYEKLGFRNVIPEEGKYCRCDVKMEMALL